MELIAIANHVLAPNKKYLTLECVKCTHIAQFEAPTRNDAVDNAVKAGWKRRSGQVICKRCARKGY